jgi:mono/diheme cytochrome c family protein
MEKSPRRAPWLKAAALLAACLCLQQWLTRETARPARAQSATPASRPAPQIDFNRDIRPLLSDRCFACHGPDAPNRGIKLRLDSESGALAALGRGRRAVVPGHPEQSELVRRITAKDEALRMPPVDSGRALSQAEIELLIEWVRQGAKFQQHWAFVTPTRPPLPTVKNESWVRNPVDRFVLARLESEGLQPSPEADRETLLRRVSLDLTGLPPTPQELDAFLNDKSSGAYEKVVDRLLASPRYGERMAFKWLDAARYADTNGYQIDGDRSAWRWRDWVIEAFNRNKPYDQFVIEQLAGDLLPPAPTPEAALDQKIATAFNRNHRINAEGGIVPEEYRVEYVVDRVDTTSTVFMGLTMGCARCHNHKYDPLTQREFYQLSAYFNSIDEDGHSFDQGNSPPLMAAPTAEQQRQREQSDRDIARAEVEYERLAAKSAAAQRRWEQLLLTSTGEKGSRHWFPEEKLLVRLAMDQNATPVFNKSDREHHEKYDRKKDEPETKFEVGFREGAPRYVPAPTGQGVAFDGKLYFDGGIRADFRYKTTSGDYRERFTISAWVYPEAEQSGSVVTKVSDSPAEVEGNVPRAGGYGMYFVNGNVHFNMIFRWGEDALRVETADALPLKEWHHVAVVFDGLKMWEERLRIYVNGREQKLKFNQRNFFLLFGNTKDTLKVGAGGGPQFRFKGALDEVRLYSRALKADEVGALACADTLDKIAAIPASSRTPAQTMKLHRAFLAEAAPNDLKQAHRNLADLREQRQKFEDGLPTLMVMEETAEPRPAHLLRRGAYDAPGERVARGVPAVLPPMPKEFPDNRLGFARWLVSPEHPLTARVQVNRFWQMFFGAGLVKTVEDFGSQGELPSHPALLDWLAVEFQQGGWGVKELLKTIVTSATYRQSSKLTPQLAQRDPDNRLHARGPRVRLSAEMIRDQALFVSGLLVEKLGGPSVKPYQPDGLYKDMTFSGLTGYARDNGEGLWRRSLYTYWKRTVLSPTMQVFDASAREFCTVREARTNTPLQSLGLMNDVTYVEAARLLAERMMRAGGTPDERLAWAFRVVTARQPGERERQALVRNWWAQLDYFKADRGEAARLLRVGERRADGKLDAVELAAYAATASLILNLDEAITKQ